MIWQLLWKVSHNLRRYWLRLLVGGFLSWLVLNVFWITAFIVLESRHVRYDDYAMANVVYATLILAWPVGALWAWMRRERMVTPRGGEHEEGHRGTVCAGADRGDERRVAADAGTDVVQDARKPLPSAVDWTQGAGSGDPALDVMAASVAALRR